MSTKANVHRSLGRSQRSSSEKKGSKRPKRSLKKLFWVWFGRLCLLGVVLAIVLAIAVAMFLSPFFQSAANRDLTKLDTKRFPVPQATVVVDASGEEFGRIFIENREWVDYGDIPENFVNALVASEDQRFWTHQGSDRIGILRAVINNVTGRGPQAGASTLTQQLARGVFPLAEDYRDENGDEDRYRRKIEEIFLAHRIEQHLAGEGGLEDEQAVRRLKQEILEQYANRIFFGRGCYGLQAASRHYFDKEPKELSLAECASLVALIPTPMRRNPIDAPKSNIKYRSLVLERMNSEGYIDEQTYLDARELPLGVKHRKFTTENEHLFAAIRSRVSELLGWEDASQGGYLVETTVDLSLQRYLEQEMEQSLREIESMEGFEHPRYSPSVATDTPYLQGAAVIMDITDGRILAMVGGRDFKHSEFNFATQARHTAGTAFLPVTYATAFAKGERFSPISLLEDSPLDLRRVQVGGLEGIMGAWGMELPEGHPRLYFEGLLSARRCLELSKLAATVRLGERLGLEKVAQTARDLGVSIEADHQLYNRFFIGQDDPGVTVMEYAKMYGVFAKAGREVPEEELIARITRPDGQIIYEAPAPKAVPELILDEVSAWQVRSCLQDTLKQKAAKTLGEVVPELELENLVGRSSTTYDWTDAWFVGANTRYACVIWAGFDRNRGSILPQGTGARLLLPMWGRVMNKMQLSAQSVSAPQAPRSTQQVEICRVSGGLAGDGCYEPVELEGGGTRFVRTGYIEHLRFDTELPEICSVHPSEPPLEFILNDQQVSGGAPADSKVFSKIQPALPTIVGEDPYGAVEGVYQGQQQEDEEEDSTEVVEVAEVEVLGEAEVIEVDALELEGDGNMNSLPDEMPFQDPVPFDFDHLP